VRLNGNRGKKFKENTVALGVVGAVIKTMLEDKKS